MPHYVPAVSNLTLLHQGKTRDTFEANGGHLLVYAADRLSTHNVVHKSLVEKKGEVLTALTTFWLKILGAQMINHHLVACGRDIYNFLPRGRRYPEDLHLRAIVVRKLNMIPVEFIYRNYMAGSLFEKFYSKGLSNPYGIELPPDMQVMSAFDRPIFTPTDKSETDEPISAAETQKMYPEAHLMGMEVFALIRSYMRSVGLEMVDSKFELGIDARGLVCLGDEVGTPDSSRFIRLWDVKKGKEPSWLDKQKARDEAIRLWNGGPKVPLEFSSDILSELTRTYLGVFQTITGKSLGKYQQEQY
jgi:phosphoribosylaminoimidazole-succinocarboxamide synthase